jgi:hypothetical protein
MVPIVKPSETWKTVAMIPQRSIPAFATAGTGGFSLRISPDEHCQVLLMQKICLLVYGLYIGTTGFDRVGECLFAAVANFK